MSRKKIAMAPAKNCQTLKLNIERINLQQVKGFTCLGQTITEDVKC